MTADQHPAAQAESRPDAAASAPPESASSADTPRKWRAVHAYCHRGRSGTDALLVEAVGPAVRDLRRRGLVRNWFFIRYWHGGPHVRVRLGGPDGAALDQAAAELRERLAAHLAGGGPTEDLDPESFYAAFALGPEEIAEMGWHADGTVVEAVYEPETERYGGDEAIGLAEDLFEVSSSLALAVIANTPAEQARIGVALDLLLAFCRGLFERTADTVRWLREYAVMWRYLDSVVARRSAGMRAAAEATFLAESERLVARRGQGQGQDGGAAAVAQWSTAVARTADWLRRREERLTGSADAVMVSQLHMLANRLGLNASDEVYLAWLASLTVAAPGERPDYFADGADAPDRAYHEQAKFRPAVFDAQRPSPGAPLERRLDFASGDPVALPLPEQDELARPLHEVISARRSRRAGLSGRLGRADLGALLGYGAGYVGSEPAEVDGRHLERGVRAHPSAGMSYPVVVRAAVYDVDGLRPAVYEYLPQQHSLQQVGQLSPQEALIDSSPFFLGDDPRIDVADAPAVLFLAADITAMRHRYGLRAHRFAMLEIGHVAQNTVLVATALGLPAALVGGFFDDAACELVQFDGYDELLGYMVPLGARPDRATQHNHTEGAMQ
ncbi:thiopeptide-type bacteriocin biosynthesis protein [Streptomonospora arabica]|uniref:Thiopeptide-type bacteriocin biosynthesis protein n=1 Tax=Streptomonospora arabica TaxID=412417 RepID=A0ABV9SRZ3_9ACTN